MILSGKELGVTSIYSSKFATTDKSKIEHDRRYIRDELKVIKEDAIQTIAHRFKFIW
jgi:hypothetical protein